MYELCSQLRRASTSIPMNIGEGYGRQSKLELGRFIKIAIGSGNEMQVALNFSRDLGYIDEKLCEQLIERYNVLVKKLYNLGKSLTNN